MFGGNEGEMDKASESIGWTREMYNDLRQWKSEVTSNAESEWKISRKGERIRPPFFNMMIAGYSILRSIRMIRKNERYFI